MSEVTSMPCTFLERCVKRFIYPLMSSFRKNVNPRGMPGIWMCGVSHVHACFFSLRFASMVNLPFFFPVKNDCSMTVKAPAAMNHFNSSQRC